MAHLSLNLKTLFLLSCVGLSSCFNINQNETSSLTAQAIDSKLDTDIVHSDKSQTDINFEEIDSLRYLTTKLDIMYQAVIEDYQGQEVFIKHFKKSHVLWKQYLEAQMLARYPENEESRGGSSFGMCYSLYKQELIKDRINSINDWLIGFPEGEMCGGSVKVKI